MSPTPTPAVVAPTADAPSPAPAPAPTPAPAPAPGPSPALSNLQSLAITPVDVKGGDPVTATISLDGPGPAGGGVVSVVSNQDDASPPSTVTVGQGNRTVTFSIPTFGVSNQTEVVITASYRGVSKSAPIRLYGAGGVPGGSGGGGGGDDDGNWQRGQRARARAKRGGDHDHEHGHELGL